jgi:beta-glucosidase
MTKNGKVIASVTLMNSGKRKGQDVAQLYIRDPVASVTRPVRMLKRFQKIELEPGESKDIIFEITEEELMMYDINMRRVVECGKFEVYIGGSSMAQLQTSFFYE